MKIAIRNLYALTQSKQRKALEKQQAIVLLFGVHFGQQAELHRFAGFAGANKAIFKCSKTRPALVRGCF